MRRTTGILFVVAAVSFAVAASVLSATFDWPDILREPADKVLRSYVDGGAALTWTWFATAWTYALLAIPILMLPQAIKCTDSTVLRLATTLGAASVLLSLIGFLRWVFVVPSLARAYVDGDVSAAAAWTAQHQFGGALLGEHLGQLLAIVWSVLVSIVVLQTRVLPRWIGWAGLAASLLYLANQGDVLATAVPGFPVWDAAGLLGSTAWGLWTILLGVGLYLQRSLTHVE
ncbi:DUF4386 domain-containing protein [Kribbella sp. NBC_00709]|uniref:DUF4386 domain-containing protein n=1 Tax=Kribbella sp. NBC_00709 TaxID=2975972 RepID=UPI002E28EF49|nr:DUF4386 domain-containing protein [Kribbella sp. NBC_00709]